MGIIRLVLAPAFFAAALVLAGCAGDEMASGGTPANVMTGETAMGTVLVDARGMTLYTFDKDPAGKSVCNGKCAENWPPLPAGADAGTVADYTVVTRDDGAKQWAYKGKPLYLWVKDQKPGDTTGEGVNDVWRVARP